MSQIHKTETHILYSDVECKGCGHIHKDTMEGYIESIGLYLICEDCGYHNKFETTEKEEKYSYYKQGFTPYEIIRAYDHIVDPAHQHALKKLIRLGQNTKSVKQDLEEVIDSLINYKEYLDEVPSDSLLHE